MHHRSLRTLGALLVGSGSAAGANAAAALVSTRLLPVDQRGTMVASLTIAALTSVVAGLGSGNSLRSLSNRTREPRLLAALPSYTWLSVAAIIGGTLVAGCGHVLLSVIAPDVSMRPEDVVSTGLATCSLIATIQVTEAWYAGGEFRTGSWFAAASALLGLATLVVTIGSFHTSAAAVSSQAAGAMLITAISVVAAKRRRVLDWGRPTGTDTRDLLRQGLRSLGGPVGLVVMTRFDRLVLVTLVSAEAVAVYALAASAAEILRLVPTATSQTLTRDIATGSGRSAVWLSQRIAILSTGFAGVPIAAAGFALFVPVFGEAYGRAESLLAVLLIGELGYAALVVAHRGLVGGGWMSELGSLGIVSAACAIPVYWMSGYYWGMSGCAVASVILYFLAGLAATSVLRSRLLRLESAETSHDTGSRARG